MGDSPGKDYRQFCDRKQICSWLIGGLNFQIEHHLFPKISHIHYPALSRITRQLCNEYGLVYTEYPYMLQAVVSHVTYLSDEWKIETCEFIWLFGMSSVSISRRKLRLAHYPLATIRVFLFATIRAWFFITHHRIFSIYLYAEPVFNNKIFSAG